MASARRTRSSARSATSRRPAGPALSSSSRSLAFSLPEASGTRATNATSSATSTRAASCASSRSTTPSCSSLCSPPSRAARASRSSHRFCFTPASCRIFPASSPRHCCPSHRFRSFISGASPSKSSSTSSGRRSFSSPALARAPSTSVSGSSRSLSSFASLRICPSFRRSSPQRSIPRCSRTRARSRSAPLLLSHCADLTGNLSSAGPSPHSGPASCSICWRAGAPAPSTCRPIRSSPSACSVSASRPPPSFPSRCEPAVSAAFSLRLLYASSAASATASTFCTSSSSP